MSNRKFEYSLEEKASLLAKFSKSMDLANEGARSFEAVSRPLQAIISDENIVVVPKVSIAPDGGRIFHVTANFASAQEAIDAGKYPRKWALANTPAEIPLVIQPVDSRVRAVSLGEYRRTKEIFGLYPNIMSPIAVLAFGALFPEEQRDKPIFSIWKDAVGKFWCVFLSTSDCERLVGVFQEDLDDKWDDSSRVLVSEPALPVGK